MSISRWMKSPPTVGVATAHIPALSSPFPKVAVINPDTRRVWMWNTAAHSHVRVIWTNVLTWSWVKEPEHKWTSPEPRPPAALLWQHELSDLSPWNSSECEFTENQSTEDKRGRFQPLSSDPERLSQVHHCRPGLLGATHVIVAVHPGTSAPPPAHITHDSDANQCSERTEMFWSKREEKW